jgi:hypothetical protein
VKGDAVWIAEIFEIGRYLLETPARRIKLVENVNNSFGVIGEVIHIGDEYSVVGTFRHEAHTL